MGLEHAELAHGFAPQLGGRLGPGSLQQPIHVLHGAVGAQNAPLHVEVLGASVHLGQQRAVRLGVAEAQVLQRAQLEVGVVLAARHRRQDPPRLVGAALREHEQRALLQPRRLVAAQQVLQHRHGLLGIGVLQRAQRQQLQLLGLLRVGVRRLAGALAHLHGERLRVGQVAALRVGLLQLADRLQRVGAPAELVLRVGLPVERPVGVGARRLDDAVETLDRALPLALVQRLVAGLIRIGLARGAIARALPRLLRACPLLLGPHAGLALVELPRESSGLPARGQRHRFVVGQGGRVTGQRGLLTAHQPGHRAGLVEPARRQRGLRLGECALEGLERAAGHRIEARPRGEQRALEVGARRLARGRLRGGGGRVHRRHRPDRLSSTHARRGQDECQSDNTRVQLGHDSSLNLVSSVHPI